MFGIANTIRLSLLPFLLWAREPVLSTHPHTTIFFSGIRGPSPAVTKEKRIRYAKELLQKDFLAHVGVSEFGETKKAYFYGYMLHRLLLAALGRREVCVCVCVYLCVGVWGKGGGGGGGIG